MTNAAHWRGLLAGCLALAFILAIIGTVPGYGEEGARPGIADRCSGGDCASGAVRGVTEYRGLVLDYEVIDGLAVHGGDMVLGTAAAAAAAAPSREPAKREASPGPVRRDLYPIENSLLWPGGRVPYVIDDRIEGRDLEVIHAAIEHWNTKTVIDWFPRTDEDHYAAFGLRPLIVSVRQGRELLGGPEDCSSASGLGVGSPTPISAGGCPLDRVIHAMGHAVGLLHEHERPDWDRFLDEEPVRFDLLYLADWNRGFPIRTGDVPELPYPYDYQSIMHYGLGRHTLEHGLTWVTTIPPGIGVSGIDGSSLSAGDIDGVARLYGKHPGTITVSTNPPGLDVIVDGDRVTAPAIFEWLPDSVHTLEAPLEQRQGEYVFGRWSDGGGPKHMVQADPNSTWFEANFIRRDPFQSSHTPRNAGSVAMSPESPDDRFVYLGSRLELTPVPAEGTAYEFARWDLSDSPENLGTARRGPRPEPRANRLQNISAVFRTPPFYRINSNVEGMLLPFEVNGRRSFAPAAFQPSELPAGTTVSVPDSWRVVDRLGVRGRYRFTGWSDGGEREHEIEAPEEGGSLTFYVQREFKLTTHAIWPKGTIVVSPDSEDGLYPAGSQVQLTAVPYLGSRFLGWEHDVSGTERTQFVIMDRDRLARATFTTSDEPIPIMVQFGEPLQVDSLNGRHYVRVPDGASSVAVRFESSAPPRDAEFYVTPAVAPSPDELGSTRLNESDTITINREALSRMWDNAHFPSGSHHLRIQQRHGVGSGKLHVSIQRDWIGGVWPRAFTMVSRVGWSRPVQQTMCIAPVEGVPPQVRYRIVSDQHWLEAVPPEWTGADGEVEIAVTANGAALAADAHAGKLEILTVRDGDPPTGGTPTGIEIPVHFVVMPSDGAEEPPVDEPSGVTGGDDHGDTPGAATEIAAGSPAQGRLEVLGDEDWFRFRTTAAKTYVTAYTVSPGDTVGELLPAGSAALKDYRSGSGLNFRITATVPAGTHLLRVTGSGTPDYTLVLEAGFPMEFVRIPAGSFVMGAPEDEEGRQSDERQHEVRISQGFWMGKYEVTQEEWEAVMGDNPSRFRAGCSRCPVERVSWDDIQEFIRRLNEQESGGGYAYRLPTEAEWEYAARAGTTGARHGELDEIAWHQANSDSTHPVGQKRANALGLHDMLGNVWEWTADWYGEYPAGEVTDPEGPRSGSRRVVRGGGWRYFEGGVRSANRASSAPGTRSPNIGFRLVRTDSSGDDHGDTPEAAAEVAVGSAAQGRLERIRDQDWFRFRTTAAQTWITAYTVSEGDTVGVLHTAAGAVVTGDDSATDRDFRIVTAVAAGTHYLRVSGSGTLDYALELKAESSFPMEFVRIPAGSFVMGSPEDEEGRDSDERQHEVRISQDFWMGKYEVTQGEWVGVMGEDPSYFTECGSMCPVEQVSWNDIQEFIRRLNEQESGSRYAYRLPTEAEWEYAARAGTTGARYGELDEIAWYEGNSGGRTHPVGGKRANAWGLHDMLGNVWEWVRDRRGEYPSGPVTDPQGPVTGLYRVYRGGSCGHGARRVRSADRYPDHPAERFSNVGFRLVRTE